MKIRNKRVFLSGPMSGIDYYNAPEFARARAICKLAGAERIFDPSVSWTISDAAEPDTHEYYMKKCINELTSHNFFSAYDPSYDILVQLPGWEDSKGARIEAMVADVCGITRIALDDVE